MDLYNQASQQAAEMITKSYSTSFSMATRLFNRDISRHVYNIYGLVRIADEIVDSYKGKDAPLLLDALEEEVYRTLKSGYSTSIIVQAFTLTARHYDIDKALIAPFFKSMRTDLTKKTFNEQEYREYVHGSAEVIGLMCLKVFCPDAANYKKLGPGAQALGAAFQKINFLRDFADDYHKLGRCYFPGVTFATFNKTTKAGVINDIESDLVRAKSAVSNLPRSSRPAVKLALRYYTILLHRLAKASPEDIKQKRFRVNDGIKLVLFARSWASMKVHRGW